MSTSWWGVGSFALACAGLGCSAGSGELSDTGVGQAGLCDRRTPDVEIPAFVKPLEGRQLEASYEQIRSTGLTGWQFVSAAVLREADHEASVSWMLLAIAALRSPATDPAGTLVVDAACRPITKLAYASSRMLYMADHWDQMDHPPTPPGTEERIRRIGRAGLDLDATLGPTLDGDEIASFLALIDPPPAAQGARQSE